MNTPNKRHPLFSQNTNVKTILPNNKMLHDWGEEARSRRKWGVEGTIIGHSDSHGLCYRVMHADGTEAFYDPSEFHVLREPASSFYKGDLVTWNEHAPEAEDRKTIFGSGPFIIHAVDTERSDVLHVSLRRQSDGHVYVSYKSAWEKLADDGKTFMAVPPTFLTTWLKHI